VHRRHQGPANSAAISSSRGNRRVSWACSAPAAPCVPKAGTVLPMNSHDQRQPAARHLDTGKISSPIPKTAFLWKPIVPGPSTIAATSFSVLHRNRPGKLREAKKSSHAEKIHSYKRPSPPEFWNSLRCHLQRRPLGFSGGTPNCGKGQPDGKTMGTGHGRRSPRVFRNVKIGTAFSNE